MTEKRLWARISAGHTDKKTKRLRVRKRERLSLLSLSLSPQHKRFPPAPSSFYPALRAEPRLLPQAAPSSISSGPASPAFFARLRTPYHLKIFQPRAHSSFAFSFSRASPPRQAFQAQYKPETLRDVADSPRARHSAWDCFKRFPSVSSVLILQKRGSRRRLSPAHGHATRSPTHDKRGTQGLAGGVLCIAPGQTTGGGEGREPSCSSHL